MYRLYVDLLSSKYQRYTCSSEKLHYKASIPETSPYETAIRIFGRYLVRVGQKLEGFNTRKALYSPLRQHSA